MIETTPALEQLMETLRGCAPEEREALLTRLHANSPEIRRQIEDRLHAKEGSSAPEEKIASGPAAPTVDLSGEADDLSTIGFTPSLGFRFVEGHLIAGRFTVVRYIARGGMGEVYEVEDRLLGGIRVALKVIRPEIAADPDSLRRFQQEVVLARTVTHPNLCPIYDIAHCDDSTPPFVFLTMKLLSGETLSSRIRKRGPIAGEDAVTIADQLIAGIAALHDVGIIHRDIKPNNVMLDTSNAKPCISIMDFGLARLHGPDAPSLAGTFAGTPGYLAPELYRGDPPSQASDLYALGVLLHEVLTGARPKATSLPSSIETPIETSAALDDANVLPVLAEAVRAFVSLDPALRCSGFDCVRHGLVSTALARADSKAIGIHSFGHALGPNSKNVETQAIASGAAANLRRRAILIRTGTWACGIALLALSLLAIPAIGERARGMLFASNEKHVAILPIEIIEANPESQAIGDGLMDSLAGKLSNLSVSNQSLWVVPASDVRLRKVTEASSAMREFGATIVVSGSLQRSGDMSRLQLSLVDPAKKRQIGFVDIETHSGDLAALQDEAVTRLARLMNLSVKGQTASPPEAQSTRAAYEDYLAGVGYFERQDQPGNIDRAIVSLESAVKTDPHFALGFAKLTDAYLLKYSFTSDVQLLKKAEEASRRGAELDDKLSANYVALASVHKLTGKMELAIQELKRAVELDPTNSEAIAGLAAVYRDQGRIQEAEASYLQAAALHPDYWEGYNNLGQFYDDIGRPRDAIIQYQRAIHLTPNNSWPYVNLGFAYEDVDDPAMLVEAEKAFKTALKLDPVFSAYSAYSDLGLLYTEEHRFNEAVEASERAVKLHDRSAEAWATLAAAYEWLKDKDKANEAWARTAQLANQSLSVNPQDAHSQAMLAPIHARLGRRDKSLDAIRISLALLPTDQYVLSQVADAYALLGDRDQAVKYLQSAIVHGMSRQQLQGDPFIPGLLSDIRISQALSKHS